MSKEDRTYIAIDLKSFFASVEAADRKLDPLAVNLVVADPSRTEKTICLAVSPALKAYGIPGRARLFEVVQKVKEVNAARLRAAGGSFTGRSFNAPELEDDKSLELDYIIAPPRMKLYLETSQKINSIYLKFIAPEDMLIYSVDEVFLDVTHYLSTYNMTAHELARHMIKEVLAATNITATAGIGSNMYLAKVAMDVTAKHIPADKDGVRIAELNEESYRKTLWNHRPLTDFWRVGPGTARKLMAHGMYTMGDVALCSVGDDKDYYNEDLLYKLFGVNAELLIDHAWGWEPCTVAEAKNYTPQSSSISSGQVLQEPYTAEKGRLVVREMADSVAMDLVEKNLVTDQVVLTIVYDIENLTDSERKKKYSGPVVKDHYGRQAPKPAHGSENLPRYTSSASTIADAAVRLYDRIVDGSMLVRRFYVVMEHVKNRDEALNAKKEYEQLTLFDDPEALEEAGKKEQKEYELQKAMLSVQKKYGKNAVLKGMNLEKGATAMERNAQIGGHRA